MGRIRRILASCGPLRSAYYLLLEVGRAVRNKHAIQHDQFERFFREQKDPWCYASDYHTERFAVALELISLAEASRAIHNVIEIGCAEGIFTEMLAGRGFDLTAIDFSETALERAQERCARFAGHVIFERCDLLGPSPPSKPPDGFDLVIVMDVLECFFRQSDLVQARQQILGMVKPDGFLLVTSTGRGPVVEQAFWSRWIARGRTLNKFMGTDPSLIVCKDISAATHQCTLYRKREIH